tara:strand:+ start:22304 stop:23557 length:1254 start_codon:yes stop_codon:yes gene_type:complete
VESNEKNNMNKYIFIHTAKTGGGSIGQTMRDMNIPVDPLNQPPLLESWSDQEYKWEKFKNFNLHSFDFSFGFVRNSYERVVSAFFTPWVNDGVDTKEDLSKEDFLLFLDKIVFNEENVPFFKWSHVMPFLDERSKLFDSDGNQRVSFIGHFENLQQDFDTACSQMNLPKMLLPHKHKSKHKHYSEYYTQEAIDIVSEFYKKDIEKFNYSFCSSPPIFLNELNEPIDTSKMEIEDQQKAKAWINKNDIVLELGARYGTVSYVINKKLSNPSNHVAVEPDERVWDCLENNRESNSCEFHILKGFISNKKLSLTNLDKYHNGYGSSAIEDDSSNIPIHTLSDVKNKYNLNFNTLFADCEGFLPTFLDENPDVLDSFYKIIFEADCPEDLPEGAYDEVNKKLQSKGFTCRSSGHFNVYIKY